MLYTTSYMSDSIDFLAVGDTVVDAFIELQDAEVHCNVNNTDCTLSMRFGDKIPYKNHYILAGVGNSANAAVSAARLGLSSALITHVGDDRYGEDCKQSLSNNNVLTDGIVCESGKPTNYHYVLWYRPERTILVKHTEFKYDWQSDINRMGKPKWLYLSSLAANTEQYHLDIAQWLGENPDVAVTFQPGTFQISLGVEKLADIYRHTALFVCNIQEAQKILHTDTIDIHELVTGLHNLGPRIVAITDGPAGAYVSDTTTVWFLSAYPDIAPPVERTGAGDAFASTMTAALVLGKSVPEALQWGPINAMSVVQEVGAQAGLLSQDRLLHFLKNAPQEYTPKNF